MTEHTGATTEEKDKGSAGGKASIRLIGAVAIAVAIALAFAAFTFAGYIGDLKNGAEDVELRHLECSEAVANLEDASDNLTTQVRTFVVTGRRESMDAYLDEMYSANRRENAVKVLQTSLSGDREATEKLEEALNASDRLAETELVAMRLAADYYGLKDLPATIAVVDVGDAYAKLKGERKLEVATELVLGEDYATQKEAVLANVDASSKALLAQLNEEIDANGALMQNLLFQLRVVVSLLLGVVMVLVLVLLMYVLKPLGRYIKRIQNNEPLEAEGSYELHYLANAYNAMYEDNNKRIEQLRQFAERDSLTGISNRSGYESFLATHTRNIALLLIDIDNFREFNEVYGHDTGDAVMVKLANALSTAFRSTDFPCRIESDLFAVVMTNMNADLRDAVSNKIEIVNSLLADDSDDLPLITISVGAAFSTEGMDDDDIYRAADTALRQVQQSGRNGLAFYGEHTIAS